MYVETMLKTRHKGLFPFHSPLLRESTPVGCVDCVTQMVDRTIDPCRAFFQLESYNIFMFPFMFVRSKRLKVYASSLPSFSQLSE